VNEHLKPGPELDKARREASFARAAGLIAGLAGITVSPRTIERSAEATGAAARAASRAEAAGLVARVIVPLPPAGPLPDMLYAEVDGTGVPVRPSETVFPDWACAPSGRRGSLPADACPMIRTRCLAFRWYLRGSVPADSLEWQVHEPHQSCPPRRRLHDSRSIYAAGFAAPWHPPPPRRPAGDQIDAPLRRMRLPYLRKAAPEVLATAKPGGATPPRSPASCSKKKSAAATTPDGGSAAATPPCLPARPRVLARSRLRRQRDAGRLAHPRITDRHHGTRRRRQHHSQGHRQDRPVRPPTQRNR
jgi:hypothetical protein